MLFAYSDHHSGDDMGFEKRGEEEKKRKVMYVFKEIIRVFGQNFHAHSLKNFHTK